VTSASGPPVVRSAQRLDPADTAAVLALAGAAADTDGVHPFSEHVLLHLRGAGEASAVHLTVVAGGELVGYAYLDLDGPSAEVVVHPARRRRGHGHALVVAAVAAAATVGPLKIWAHGDHPGARALADRIGLTRGRVLWQMRRSLFAALPEVPLPDGVALRAFRPGADDEAWLAVNARAFVAHPEQGRWTIADLAARKAEPWFDPAGFLLAVDPADDRLLGYHWTKVHPAQPRTGTGPGTGTGTAHDQAPIGEVYVLGVDPGGHRKGLGAALTAAGLRHLRGLGLSECLLYVDESNAGAVKLYERFGFTVWATDVMYEPAA
jgi:mycothiol synthase